MKKWIVMLLVLVMVMGAAQAESMNDMLRERKLIVNGVEETLTESKYVSENGFVLWVDADHFWPLNMNGGGNDEFVDTAAALDGEERAVYIIMVDSEVPNAEAESFIGEAVAMYPPEDVTEAASVLLPTGLEYVVQQAVEEGTVYRFYAIKGPEHLVCVTAGFPEAQADEYITRVDALINSMEFVAE